MGKESVLYRYEFNLGSDGKESEVVFGTRHERRVEESSEFVRVYDGDNEVLTDQSDTGRGNGSRRAPRRMRNRVPTGWRVVVGRGGQFSGMRNRTRCCLITMTS